MVTIIMPVHDTGKLLKESIGSVISQTFHEWELICVDDASHDTLTIELLKAYKDADSRVRVITLGKNIGAAEARNIGLVNAHGEYIIFLDADDRFDRVMVEKMYSCIKKYDADICICGYREFSDYDQEIVSVVSPVQKTGITNRVFSLDELPDDGLMYCGFAPWNKICRTEFLKEQNIHFQSLPSANDVFFSCMCSLCAERIVYCQDGLPLIDYRIHNKNQISANRNPNDFYDAIYYLINKRKHDMSTEEYRKIIYVLLRGMIWNFGECHDELKRKKSYTRVSKFLKENASDLDFNIFEANNIYRYFLNEDYESNWFDVIGDYYAQIKKNEKKLMQELNGYLKIIIWGNGKRGNALQKVFKENHIDSVIVTDKKNKNIGGNTLYGYRIVSTDQIDNSANVIIASNEIIYRYLKQRFDWSGSIIINLEKYCPFD